MDNGGAPGIEPVWSPLASPGRTPLEGFGAERALVGPTPGAGRRDWDVRWPEGACLAFSIRWVVRAPSDLTMKEWASIIRPLFVNPSLRIEVVFRFSGRRNRWSLDPRS